MEGRYGAYCTFFNSKTAAIEIIAIYILPTKNGNLSTLLNGALVKALYTIYSVENFTYLKIVN